MDYGPKIGAISINYGGAAVTAIVKNGESVSYVCGSLGNGQDYCGTRTIKFYA
jgi:hypothetical protein